MNNGTNSTSDRISVILITGLTVAFLVLLIGVIIIAITRDGNTTDIMLTAFATLMGVMAGGMNNILQHYLTSKNPIGPTASNQITIPVVPPEPVKIQSPEIKPL